MCEEAIISELSVIKSKKVSVQVCKGLGMTNIENSQDIKLYLSNEALKTEILTMLTEQLTVIEFEDEEGHDHAIPMHFSSKWEKGAFTTNVV